MWNLSVKEKCPWSILQRIYKTSATNLQNETLKLELDQMIIKWLIDKNYKTLGRDRLYVDSYLSLMKLILPSPMRMETTEKFRSQPT